MEDPTQNIANELTKTKILSGSIELFDINILPERYQRKRIRLIKVLPWFLLIILLTAIYPSWRMASEAQALFVRKQAEYSIAQNTFEVFQSNVSEFEALQAEITSAQQQKDQIISSYEGLQLQASNWNMVLNEIKSKTPAGIYWTLISVEEHDIILEGISDKYSAILDLEDTLNSFGFISNVDIESIELSDPDEIIVMPSETGENSETIIPSSSPYTFTINAILIREVLP